MLFPYFILRCMWWFTEVNLFPGSTTKSILFWSRLSGENGSVKINLCVRLLLNTDFDLDRNALWKVWRMGKRFYIVLSCCGIWREVRVRLDGSRMDRGVFSCTKALVTRWCLRGNLWQAPDLRGWLEQKADLYYSFLKRRGMSVGMALSRIINNYPTKVAGIGRR